MIEINPVRDNVWIKTNTKMHENDPEQSPMIHIGYDAGEIRITVWDGERFNKLASMNVPIPKEKKDVVEKTT